MPFVALAGSPLVPGVSPVRIHYRDAGAGPPIVFLHSGWGYEIYPFDPQMAAFAPSHRVVSPDRSGYGQSTAIAALPSDFHHRAAGETRAVIEALGLERPVLWGHSDGAIIALLLALETPALVKGVIAEATHFYRRKPRSRDFFASAIGNGSELKERERAALERDHGVRWPDVLERHSQAWQDIAEHAASDFDDFYDGRLGGVAAPVLAIHGARDPRTEPGEIEALHEALVGADLRVGPGRTHRSAPTTVVVLPDGKHSPHSQRTTAAEIGRLVLDFIDEIGT